VSAELALNDDVLLVEPANHTVVADLYR